MNKTVVLSLAAAAVLSASSLNGAFAEGKASGQIRMAYVTQNNDVDTDTYGTSIGGILKYETAPWNDIKLGVGAYVSQKLHFATGNTDEGRANPDLFGDNISSYAYVGEGYIDYSADDITLRIGRQRIDTPFADSDDIRMHPNTFESAIATYKGIDDTTLIGGYITRWAGYDSENDISKFKKIVPESNGAAVFGILNESVEHLELQGWYYGIDKLTDIFYTDASYTIPFNKTTGLEFVGQGIKFKEENGSGVDGNVYGIGANLTIGMFTLGTAYNEASNEAGKFVISGLGNGAYLVDTEEMNLDNFEDIKAYMFSAELDMEEAGLEGLTLTAIYAGFKSAPADMKEKEIDLIATYEITKSLSAEVNYAILNDQNNNTSEDGLYSGGYDRFLVRVNYNF
ncbi:MAG: OprD family outer membrane porin [Sulfuricurvum sp.]|uniref:OprD family outer membrane porin n=1 Tax=Sulfuricurvum sp. TaxID=2025608 RepID=UPI00262EA5E3|nr:OprD family outer membrane porin [Sulfuricurvum sp.]MDD5158747.1 OprD family outer membrane porin [Sulfuricurvum sp.]